MTREDLEIKIQEIRRYKAMAEEATNIQKSIEAEVIAWMTSEQLDTAMSDTAKITFKDQSRTTLDRKALEEVLGEDLKPYEKTTTYKVLRIK
ncbi:hypothetical protein [Gallintestinimicrobium sp.]|uniref:hypothetical protein n=1 Tax=Gallintestinimicrobium sp. TaxID=2981655 RepID=UPI0039921D29